MSTQGGLDGSVDFLLASHVNSGDDVAVVVGHHLLNHIASEDLFTVDDARNLQHFRGLSLEFNFKFSPFLAAWQVAEHRFVHRGRWLGNAVHHKRAS